MAIDHKRNGIRRGIAMLIALVMSVGGAGYTAVKNGEGQKVRSDGALVYSSDDEQSELLFTLEHGDKYTLLSIDDEWCKIRIESDDIEGFVQVDELELDVDGILEEQSKMSDGLSVSAVCFCAFDGLLKVSRLISINTICFMSF